LHVVVAQARLHGGHLWIASLEPITLDLYREAPRRDEVATRSESGRGGAFDKVVRSEPLARAPRCLNLWVLNVDEACVIGRRWAYSMAIRARLG